MKKIIGLMLLLIGLWSVFAWGDAMIPSAVKTVSALISGRPGYVYGISVTTDGSNACTIDLYDNMAGSGTKVVPTWTVPATPVSQAYSFNPPIKLSTGLYVSVTTSGTISYVVYQ